MIRQLVGILCISLVALAQISAPRIGFVRDSHGVLRALYGVAGAFLLGAPIVTGVVAAGSFGNEYALAATESEVVLVRGDAVIWRRALRGAEAFSFKRNGSPHWVRFGNGRCLVWSEKAEPELASFCTSDSPVRAEGADVEQVAPEWLLRRDSNRLYLTHTGTDEAVFELPEAPE